MADAFLLSAARTPIGKYLGALADVPAPQLGAVAIAEALRRASAPVGAASRRSKKSSSATSSRPASARTRPGRRR